MSISPHVVIMTAQELADVKSESFKRGVERGRFEAGMDAQAQPVARNCVHWNDGRCENCGAQHQFMKVHADFRCPHFTRR